MGYELYHYCVFLNLDQWCSISFLSCRKRTETRLPLSPLLFLLVAKGLRRSIREAKRLRTFRGIQIALDLQLTHLLFVDDVLIFCSSSARDLNTLTKIVYLFSIATGMEINVGKSTLSTHLLNAVERQEYLNLFPLSVGILEGG